MAEIFGGSKRHKMTALVRIDLPNRCSRDFVVIGEECARPMRIGKPLI